MNLDDFKIHTVEQSGLNFIFTFLISENPTLEDYRVRSALLAHCVNYPMCTGGQISNPVAGVVTAIFSRRFG